CPSITYKGSVLALIDVWPRMRTAIPPSGVRVIQTPGTCDARTFSIGSSPARSRSSPVTVVAATGGPGEGAGPSVSTGRAALLEAQPELAAPDSARGEWDG